MPALEDLAGRLRALADEAEHEVAYQLRGIADEVAEVLMLAERRAAACDEARELRRCLLSTMGFLESVCDHMPTCPEGSSLRAQLEGGWPETLAMIDLVVDRLGGPSRDDDESCAKSFNRGYQVEVLSRREEVAGGRDPQEWAQDPDEFMESYEPAAGCPCVGTPEQEDCPHA